MKNEITKLFGKRGIGIGLGVALLLGVSAMPARAIEMGDFVWLDANRNGIQDDGATGINGVTVKLFKCETDELIASTITGSKPVTGEAGWYQFAYDEKNLNSMQWNVSYYVKFYPLSGYEFSPQYRGVDRTLDSNADPSTGESECFTLPYRDSQGKVTVLQDLTFDAGLVSVPPPSDCWLTGGGTIGKIQGVANYSFGGVVYPGCSPKAAEGGNWNVIDHFKGLHFQGQQITVEGCSGVATKSPKVNVNVIDFYGNGILSGIGGNPDAKMAVTFVGRAVDNQEPGGGSDFLYLNVIDEGSNIVLQIGNSKDDPATLSTGNLQIHTTGCD